MSQLIVGVLTALVLFLALKWVVYFLLKLLSIKIPIKCIGSNQESDDVYVNTWLSTEFGTKQTFSVEPLHEGDTSVAYVFLNKIWLIEKVSKFGYISLIRDILIIGLCILILYIVYH